MSKQTVYLNNFARKSGFRLQFPRQSAFKTHHYWRGLTSPMKEVAIRTRLLTVMYTINIAEIIYYTCSLVIDI